MEQKLVQDFPILYRKEIFLVCLLGKIILPFSLFTIFIIGLLLNFLGLNLGVDKVKSRFIDIDISKIHFPKKPDR